ncbi:hypothetical protein EQV77_11170 [Halobacillus fulvus]|nr:hypothetical protein EQV77_11170 [Halobacillus fulvus]
MNHLHDQLMDAKKRMLQQQRLEREVIAFQGEERDFIHKEAQLREKLKDEEEDVERLERLGMANMFYTVTGRKLEKLDQEKQEALEARVKWKEAFDSLKDVREELEALIERLQALEGADDEYKQIRHQRKQFLIDQGEEKGERLLRLAEARSKLEAEQEEILEAVEAGEKADEQLGQAIKLLDSAETWGTVDMFGGGLFTTSIKHSRMDDANQKIHDAERYLRKFANEVKDIEEYVAPEIKISTGLTIADYFFDNLLADLFVQNRIQSANGEVKKVRRNTQTMITDLKALQEDFEEQLRSIEKEQTEVLELK